MRTMTIAAACLLAAGTAHAQTDQERAVRERVKTMTAQLARVPLERATVKGAPYSAETVTENTQTLADGNRIARKVTGRVFRDGEGRTRREEDHADGSMTISIVDPVANVSYRLDPEQRIAWKTSTDVGGMVVNRTDAAQVEERRKVEAAEGRGRRGAGAGGLEPTRGVAVMRGGMMTRMDEPGPVEKKTIDGVAVEGRKTTTTIPAGQVGNELPITITSEEWRSPDLQVLVLTHYSDPRMGESTYRLTNVVRAEPDPSLFQVPAGYTIRETGIRRNDQPR